MFNIMLVFSLLFHYIIVIIIAAPCIPKSGLTGLIIGQDYYNINNYTKYIEDNNNPYGIMVYTTLFNNSTKEVLPGTVNATDYGSGVEWVSGVITTYPTSSIQLGLYIVNQCESIISGK